MADDPVGDEEHQSLDKDIDEEESEDDIVKTKFMLKGPGKLKNGAYAVLCGINIDEMDGDDNYESCPPRIFPLEMPNVILGRKHAQKSRNFIALGKNTLLSRNHCRIYFRDFVGGKIDLTSSDDGDQTWTYIDVPDGTEMNKKVVNADGINSYFVDGDNHCGSFAVEVIGKNPVVVDGISVLTSEIALLHHKSTIQLGPWRFYFLLPLSDDESDQKVPNKVKVPNPELSMEKKRKNDEKLDDTSTKRLSLSSGASLKSNSTNKYETLSLDELLEKMTVAFANSQWTRREQMLGTTIAVRAVTLASRNKKIREIAKKEHGVNRLDVVKWLDTVPKLGGNSALFFVNLLNILISHLKSFSFIPKYQHCGNSKCSLEWR